MKLNVFERVILLNVLPKTGNFTNLKILRKLGESLSFNEEENAKLNFRQEGEMTLWNEVEIIKNIKIGNVATALIVKELTKLDEEEKLTNDHFSLCEKFLT